MNALRNLFLASSLALGAIALVASPAFAADPAPPKKEEMKCDKDGKACKGTDANCKVENCKKKEEGTK